MALLTGALYSKKGYGRSLFGDLGQHSTDLLVDTPKNDNKKETETTPETNITEKDSNPPSADKKSFSNGEGLAKKAENPESEIKVILKKFEESKTKKISKPFFHPKLGESNEGEVDKDAADVEIPDKKTTAASKKKTVPNAQLASSKQKTVSAVSQKVTTTTKAKVASKVTAKQQSGESHISAEPISTSNEAITDNSTAKIKKTLEELQETHGKKEQLDAVQPPDTNPENEDSSEELSSEEEEEKGVTEESPANKPIIIKSCPPSRHGDRLRTIPEEIELEPVTVLQPDAIADIKRELAKKGILEGFVEENEIENEGNNEAEITIPNIVADSAIICSNVHQEMTETLPEGQEEFHNIDYRKFNEEERAKLDKRDGYKTNKSFEIRRLQAKAEREREGKSRGFTRPKFLKKSRVSCEDISKQVHGREHIAPDHRKNWVRKKPKSILKAQTPQDMMPAALNGNEKKKDKPKSAVRIREPEYDYNEYTDDESIEEQWSPSSSVLGYRPNSATSFSSDDVSLNSEYFTNEDGPTWHEEEDFYRSSSQGLHDVYDEIDRLDPSRLANFKNSDGISWTPEPRETYSRQRVASATNSALARSSYHVMDDPRYYQRQRENMRSKSSSRRHQPAVNTYEDGPLHLFDTMRYENSQKSQRKSKTKTSNELDLAAAEEMTDGNRRSAPRRISQQRSRPNTRESNHGAFANGGIAFGPNILPIPNKSDGVTNVSEGEWVNRVQKFFATADAGRKKNAVQRKKIRRFRFIRRFFSKKKMKKKLIKKSEHNSKDEIIMPALCYSSRCETCFNCLTCSTNSVASQVAIISIITIAITTAVILGIFWAVGIFPL